MRIERRRDVPRSCTCGWKWLPDDQVYARRYPNLDCVWHGPARSLAQLARDGWAPSQIHHSSHPQEGKP
jgi:hypothetical protein